MRARRGLLLLFVVALAGQSVAQGTLPRVGLLRQAYPTDAFTAAFLEEMRTLGYVEGETVTYETRWAEGNPDRVSDLARDLAGRKVDVIVTGGDNAILAAKQAAPHTPVVMAASNDPAGAGLVKSLARPGRTVTGLTIFSQELSQKRLEVFRESVPNLSRVAVLRNPKFEQ